MADYYVQGSFSFTCTAAESALIEEAWQHAADLGHKAPPGEPSAQFLAAFPPTDLGNPFNGLLEMFDDPNFPIFGADIEISGADSCLVSIFGATDFQPDAIAALVQRCCQQTLSEAPIGFEWSYSSSRPRGDGIGGGWCAVFVDRIEYDATSEALARALRPVAHRDPWVEDPAHPVRDWQGEVANDDTRLGYLDWVDARGEALPNSR
ncbi:MAG TPA: hypothetical protein VF509_00205 [Sphingobium sp.]